eukprot:UN3171
MADPITARCEGTAWSGAAPVWVASSKRGKELRWLREAPEGPRPAGWDHASLLSVATASLSSSSGGCKQKRKMLVTKALPRPSSCGLGPFGRAPRKLACCPRRVQASNRHWSPRSCWAGSWPSGRPRRPCRQPSEVGPALRLLAL